MASHELTLEAPKDSNSWTKFNYGQARVKDAAMPSVEVKSQKVLDNGTSNEGSLACEIVWRGELSSRRSHAFDTPRSSSQWPLSICKLADFNSLVRWTFA